MSHAVQTHPDPDHLEIHMQLPVKPAAPAVRSVTYPTRSLFKPADGFVWVRPEATDIRKTIERAREAMKESA